MRSPRLAGSVAVIALALLLSPACAPSTIDTGDPPPGGRPPPGQPPPGADGGATRGGDADPAAPPQKKRLAIAVIDVQESFVKIAANASISQILANAWAVLDLAGKHKPPLLITYEASKDPSTGSALPAKLRAAVPPHAREFIKTTFAATSLPAFATAVAQADPSHVVVLGAETDVCVLQTVLGLRALGRTVILQQDAVFTSEPNTGPALRRMRQAGVLLAGMSQVRSYIEDPTRLPPAAAKTPVTIIKPLKIAAILTRFSDAALGGVQDKNKAAKQARLRELLLLSEWFDFPLFGTDASTALPAAFKGLITKPIRPVAELAQATGVEQLVIAGVEHQLPALVDSHLKSREVFIMEDAMVGASSREALYLKGAVPLTYKAFYYGMTKSVDLKQWPSPSWVQRDPVYYPKTKAPEDLPPIVK